MGDLTAGLFIANLLNGKSDIEAFEHTANAVNDVMTVTQQKITMNYKLLLHVNTLCNLAVNIKP